MSTGILTVTLSSTELASEGIVAKGFAKDLTSSTDEYIERWLLEVNRELGPVSVIHWNACTHMQKSVLELTNEDFDEAMAIVKGFVATVRLALPHLRHQYQPAILVTTGGTGLDDPASNQMSAQNKLDALVIQAALKRKLVGLLHAELQPQGVYVGEVVVMGAVERTSWDTGNATIAPEDVADDFWILYNKRKMASTSRG
eukprot:jgi/Chrzof1/6720/Cz19g06240.t1